MDVFQTPELRTNNPKRIKKYKKVIYYAISCLLLVFLAIFIYYLFPKKEIDIYKGLSDSLVYRLKNLNGVEGRVELVLRYLYGQINTLPDSITFDANSVIFSEPPDKRDSCNFFILKQKLLNNGTPTQILLSDKKFYKESNIESLPYLLIFNETNSKYYSAECYIDYIEKNGKIFIKNIEISLYKTKDNEIQQLEIPPDTVKKQLKKKEDLKSTDTIKNIKLKKEEKLLEEEKINNENNDKRVNTNPESEENKKREKIDKQNKETENKDKKPELNKENKNENK